MLKIVDLCHSATRGDYRKVGGKGLREGSRTDSFEVFYGRRHKIVCLEMCDVELTA